MNKIINGLVLFKLASPIQFSQTSHVLCTDQDKSFTSEHEYMTMFNRIKDRTVRIEMNERSRVTKSTFCGSSLRYLKFVRSIIDTRSSL